MPKDENELIVPAREGTLRVLRAARDAGVRRVVVTSSFAAIGYGHPPTERTYTESDWTNTDAPGVTGYVKSKALAERAAWDFIGREGGALELAVVNPGGIFGPVLAADYSSSIEIIARMLNGSLPFLPHLYANVVDVRDVADLHLRAMTHPAAKGERFLASAGSMSFPAIAQAMKAGLGSAGAHISTRTVPDWVVRLGAHVNPLMAQIAPEVGKTHNTSSAKAERLLGWKPRPKEDAVVATAESLIRLGLLQPAAKAG
jgi:dihydroflavonol-4-reductase